MKKTIFSAVMKAASLHSAALQSIGFTKWQVRDYSPIHHILVSIASALA